MTSKVALGLLLSMIAILFSHKAPTDCEAFGCKPCIDYSNITGPQAGTWMNYLDWSFTVGPGSSDGKCQCDGSSCNQVSNDCQIDWVMHITPHDPLDWLDAGFGSKHTTQDIPFSSSDYTPGCGQEFNSYQFTVYSHNGILVRFTLLAKAICRTCNFSCAQ